MKDQNLDHSRYKVIPRVLVFIFHSGHILLIRDSHKKKWQGKYNAPGGHVEFGEDIHSAARRELEEEAGITGVNLQLVGNIMIDVEPELGISLFLIKGEAASTEVRSSNEGEVTWLDIKQIDNHEILDDMRELIPLVDQWKTGDHMIIGHYQNIKNEEVRIFSNT